VRIRHLAPLVFLSLPACSTTCATPRTLGPHGGNEVQTVIEKASRKTLTAFQSEEDLRKFLDELKAAQKREADRRAEVAKEAPAPQAAPTTASDQPDKQDDSITNNQHAGVDEGGIVKTHGDHLVILRRGRLFTVKVGDDTLSPVSSADAYGSGINPSGAWYDEMLVSRDRVIVIGYSYQRGGTEVGLFDIDRAGALKYRATYHLRSNDYYSSRNYASRVVGDKLVFYTPSYLHLGNDDPYRSFPAVRRWHEQATDGEFKRIVEPTRIYRPIDGIDGLALHTVTTCDLSKADMPCTASSMMGPAGRVFYVSPGSVYVWMTAAKWLPKEQRSETKSALVRMPLDGSAPTALRVSGAPIDQFSFLEERDHLDVMVRSDSAGDGMWSAETTAGDVAMMRVPLGLFSDGVATVSANMYTRLPKPKGYTIQNRFVGQHLLYGAGSSWGYGSPDQEKQLFALRIGSSEATTVELSHGVDRIEALGKDAIIVGGDGKDLHFTSVALGGKPAVVSKYTRKEAAQGELRSHGFFYKPESDAAGLLGLPIRGAGKPGYAHLVEGSAQVLFLRNDKLDLREIGNLEARPGVGQNDACKASCVDWYGNARPIFLKGRVFALMGYELVEGQMNDGRLTERRRVSFAPSLPLAR
jgi:hypothetical protein